MVTFPTSMTDASALASNDRIMIADYSDANRTKDCTLDVLRQFLIAQGIDDLWQRNASTSMLSPENANDSVDLGTGIYYGGAVAMPDGSAAEPVYTFENDVDTGAYRSGSDEFAISCGGSRVGYFDASGLTVAGALDIGANAFTVNSIEIVGADGEVNAAAIEDKFLRNDGDDTTIGKLTMAGADLGANALTVNSIEVVGADGEVNKAAVEDSGNWDAAYSHVSNDGSDHSYINQSVTTAATPSFAGLTIAGQMSVSSATYPPVTVERTSALTNSGAGAFSIKHKTSGNMADGFGSGFVFDVEDATSGNISIGSIWAVRDGADTYGKVDVYCYHGAAYKRASFGYGEVVINDDSDDVDFRVESNNNANMLFVDGGNDRVGIGTSATQAGHTLTVCDENAGGGVYVYGANAPGYSMVDTTNSALCSLVNQNGVLQVWCDYANSVSGSEIDLGLDGAVRVKITSSDLRPGADDTYYLGKNDDDSPAAWKGVIVKDTTNGKYYRVEVVNGTVTATDLTD